MIVDKMKEMSTLPYEDFADSLLGLQMLKTCWKHLWLDAFKSVKKGRKVDAEKYVLCSVPSRPSAENDDWADGFDINANYQEGKEPCDIKPNQFVSLAEIARKDVPLVLNFGSCS